MRASQPDDDVHGRRRRRVEGAAAAGGGSCGVQPLLAWRRQPKGRGSRGRMRRTQPEGAAASSRRCRRASGRHCAEQGAPRRRSGRGGDSPDPIKRRAPKKFVPVRGATGKTARSDGLAGEGPSAGRAKRRAHGGGVLGCPALAQGRGGAARSAGAKPRGRPCVAARPGPQRDAPPEGRRPAADAQRREHRAVARLSPQLSCMRALFL